MIRYLLTWILCISTTAALAQFEASFGFAHTRPEGTMNQQIASANGFQVQMLYYLPKLRLAVGIDAAMSSYSKKTSMQTYHLADGTSMETEVSAQSNFSSLSLASRLELTEGKLLTPYIVAKVGYHTFETNLYVTDPEDEDDCRPLENTVLFKDRVPSIAGGAGLSLNISRLFKSNNSNIWFLDFSSHYTVGGNVRYMNVNLPPSNPNTHSHSHPSSDHVAPYYARFINVVSQVEHEHHVGDVYKNPLRLLDFTLTLRYRML